MNHPNAIIWLDDASRMALAGGEFEQATHVESIDQFKEAQTRAQAFNILIGEVNKYGQRLTVLLQQELRDLGL